jgi:glycerol-3-phosphate acyltransferase PlsY
MLEHADWSRIVPLLLCAGAFLLGSLPFAALGVRGRAATFALNLAKGALPVFLASSPWTRGIWERLESALGAELIGQEGFPAPLLWAIGFFAVLGHCYSPWLRFRGGKGVSAGFGVFLILSPFAAAAGLVAYGFAFALRRSGALASVAGVATLACAHLVIGPVGVQLWFGAAIVFLVLLRHEADIDALLTDREAAVE